MNLGAVKRTLVRGKSTVRRYEAEHPLAVALAISTLVILLGLYGAQAAASYLQREIVVDPAVTNSFLAETTSEQRAQLNRDLAATLQRMRGDRVDTASVGFTLTRAYAMTCERPLSVKWSWPPDVRSGCDEGSSEGKLHKWEGTLRWIDWSTDAGQWRPKQCGVDITLLNNKLRGVPAKSCRRY